MSIVKMDMEEYKALMKVQEVLEKSLKTEAVLRQELADAQEEKIRAMKSAEKSITLIEQVETIEHVTFLRPAEDIVRILRTQFQEGRIDRFWHNLPTDTGHKNVWHQVADAFFGKTTSTALRDTLVTRKGFDETISAIRQEIKDEMTDEVKDKLSRLAELQGILADYKRQVSGDAIIISDLKSKATNFELELKGMTQDYESLDRWYDESSQKLAEINTIIHGGGWNLWTATKAIGKIRSIIIR